MKHLDKKSAARGFSLSTRLIMTLLLAAPLHIYVGIPEMYAFGLGAILSFAPTMVKRTTTGAAAVSFNVVTSIFRFIGRIIESIFGAIGKALDKTKEKTNTNGQH